MQRSITTALSSLLAVVVLVNQCIQVNASTVCVDVPNWKDSMDADCKWYERNDPDCSLFANCCATKGLTAKAACCACGGGKSYDPDVVHSITSRHHDDSSNGAKSGGHNAGRSGFRQPHHEDQPDGPSNQRFEGRGGGYGNGHGNGPPGNGPGNGNYPGHRPPSGHNPSRPTNSPTQSPVVETNQPTRIVTSEPTEMLKGTLSPSFPPSSIGSMSSDTSGSVFVGSIAAASVLFVVSGVFYTWRRHSPKPRTSSHKGSIRKRGTEFDHSGASNATVKTVAISKDDQEEDRENRGQEKPLERYNSMRYFDLVRQDCPSFESSSGEYSISTEDCKKVFTTHISRNGEVTEHSEVIPVYPLDDTI